MKNNNNKLGYSMVEISIGMIVGLAVIFGVYKIFQTASESTNSSQRRLDLKNDLSLVSSNLSKALSGETRFYAFSGIAAPEKRFYRMFIPFAQVGRNLSEAPSYADDAGLVYVGYDRNITPTVKAVCSDDAAFGRVLLDQGDSTFGSWEVVGNVIKVNPSEGYPGGDIVVTNNLQFSLFNAPQAIMWVATGNIEALGIDYYAQNETTGAFIGTGGTPKPECLKFFRVRSYGPPVLYDLDNFYFVPMRPFVLSQITDGSAAAVSLSDLQAATSNTPFRFFQTEVRTLGTLEENLGGKMIKTFGISKCHVSAVDQIECDDTVLNAGPVQSVRLESQYKIDLKMDNPCTVSTRSAPEAYRYEMRKAGMTASPWCPGNPEDAGPCVLLEIPAFPYRVTSATGGCTPGEQETMANIDNNIFTLLKQDLLAGFNFWINTAEGKVEHVQINFPD
jgi:hypothetical protein